MSEYLKKDTDKSKLENDTIFGDVDAVIQNIRSERFSLWHRGILWNCFLNQKPGKLLVILNGRRKNCQAEFKRWSWHPFVDGTLLNIDDPMIQQHKGLELGWYIGTDEVDYCDYVVEIVRSFAEKIKSEEVIFYGSSGGGAAAIRCAAKYKGSISVTINPQLFLSAYSYADSFQRITHLNLREDALQRENAGKYILAENAESKHIICINRKSENDRIQLGHFVENGNEMDIGLHPVADNCILWLYDANWYKPHSAQEWPAMFLAIMNLAENFRHSDAVQLGKMYANEYRIYSYLWEDHYEGLDELERARKALRTIDVMNIKQGELSVEGGQMLFSETEIVIPPQANEFNRYKLPIELKPNSLYFVEIRQENNAEIPYFIIKDTIYQPVLLKKSLEGGVTYFAFATHSDVEGMKAFLCPSYPKKNEGAGAVIEKCTVYRM